MEAHGKCGDGSRPAMVRGIHIILGSSADMSVLPMSFATAGKAFCQRSVLRDAQGHLMPGGPLCQAVTEINDDFGNIAQLKESFGKLLKRGWKVEGDGSDVKLAFGDFSKTSGFRSNSLAAVATVCRRWQQVEWWKFPKPLHFVPSPWPLKI